MKPIEIIKEKASKEPIKLKKHWFFGLLFILTWLTIITVIVLAVVRLFAEQILSVV